MPQGGRSDHFWLRHCHDTEIVKFIIGASRPLHGATRSLSIQLKSGNARHAVDQIKQAGQLCGTKSMHEVESRLSVESTLATGASLEDSSRINCPSLIHRYA